MSQSQQPPQPQRALLMSWSDVCLCAPLSQGPIARGVNGYVEAGGITAIMGVSSSGKSVLMQALAGRSPSLWKHGTVVLHGVEQSLNQVAGDIVYEQDLLIGDLTVKQVLSTALNLRGGKMTSEQFNTRLQQTAESLGLGKVLHSVIGTVLRRGVSGGQRRRVSVGVEIVEPPTILFIDEPTSGLDASTALSLMQYLQNLVRNSEGQIGVIVSLQQPNTRLLRLVDHLLLLGQGGTLFFGTLDESMDYFRNLGLPVPEDETPTDFYLQVTDTSSVESQNIKFVDTYRDSSICFNHLQRISAYRTSGSPKKESWKYRANYFKQFTTLLHRNLAVIVRDPTLYILQLMLHSFYGFMIGAVFFQYSTVINNQINNVFAAITWLVFLNCYIHVFKTYFLVTTNARFYHEHQNHAYAALPYWLAEGVATAIGSIVFIPGITIPYFMMHLPSSSYGFTLLVLYTLCLTAESGVHFVSMLFKNASYATVATQALMVILCLFTTGSLIQPDEVGGWYWLQDVSFFSWASFAVADDVLGAIVYSCANDGSFSVYDSTTETCNTLLLGIDFPCDHGVVSGVCYTKGKTVLSLYKGITDQYRWDSFGKLVALFFGFKFLILLCYYFPIQETFGKLVSLMLMNSKKIKEWADVKPLKADVVLPMEHKIELSRKSINRTEYDDSKAPQLVWRDLTLTLSKGKVLLDHVSGVAKAGRVMSLMGPSGAGKTTLLNALCGRATYARVQGHVQYDNRPLTRQDLDYVQQFDELNDHFTVHETIMYTACLKKRSEDHHKDLVDRVEELLKILGLVEVQNKTPSKLTGGQRKRVSIGVGLVARPSVLFLDEPTTGLDSSAAYTIVRYIGKATRATGVVCIMTIHQPSAAVFRRLDDLYLLDQGRLAFAGSLTEAEAHFSDVGFTREKNENPADFYLDLVAKSPSQMAEQLNITLPSGIDETVTWSQLYYKSRWSVNVSASRLAANQGQVAPAPVKRRGEVARFFILLWKLTLTNLRTPVYPLRTVELLILAVYLGLLYLQVPHDVAHIDSLAGASFMQIWVVLFSVVAGAPSWCIERRIVQVEYANGQYALMTYKAAQLFASLPFNLICALIYQAPLFWMIGFNNWGPAFVYAFLMSMALLILFEGVVLTVVEAVKNANLATTVCMVMLGMFFLFPGFFISMDDMPPSVKWIPWLIATTWATEGTLWNNFNGQTFGLVGGGSIGGNNLITGLFHEPQNENKWQNWAIVIGWCALFHMSHYMMMFMSNLSFGRAQKGGASSTQAGVQSSGGGSGGGGGSSTGDNLVPNAVVRYEENIVNGEHDGSRTPNRKNSVVIVTNV